MEYSERFAVNVVAAPAGPDLGAQFEILAITAGVGNGWIFSEAVLRDSLALWEGAACFVDHSLRARSLRDLAGVLRGPRWDTPSAGIRAWLAAVGPAGGLLQDLGRALLADAGAAQPRIGFSADVVFQAEGKTVLKIVRVNSLDLVFNPARGGAFVSAFQMEGETMEEQIRQEGIETGGPAALEEARALRAQLCAYLLDSGLAAAKLPAPLAERVRKQFAGQVFEAAELDEAVRSARELLGQLQAGAVVQGPGRIGGMADSTDRLQAAVSDLFEVPRDPGTEGLKVERLSGIRELYLTLTGDVDLHGGYDRGRVQLATTADFTGLVKNALNKIVANTWETMGQAGYNWWESVVVNEHFNSLNDVTGILVGTVGDLPLVAEGAAYTELAVGDSPEVASFKKYGGYVPLTLELIDRDNTRKLKAYARELGNAGMRKISSLVAGIFTQNSGSGPTLADSGALFNATVVTSAGGHANLRTTALSAAEWDSVGQAMYNQPALVKNAAGYYGSGPKLGVNPRFLLVPRQLMLGARQILYPGMERAANIFSQNMQQGQPGDVIVVPDWTDANDFAAVADPRILPGIYIGDRFGIKPEIFIAGEELSPAVFMNDESRLKVRHFLAVWVNDFRPLAKNNVA